MTSSGPRRSSSPFGPARPGSGATHARPPASRREQPPGVTAAGADAARFADREVTVTPGAADVRSRGPRPPVGPHPASIRGAPAAEPLGRMVRRLRLDADLTLERLSEASGISDRALSDIERGAARGPQHRTVLAIAAALGLTGTDRHPD